MMFDVESNGIAEVIKYKYLGGCKSYCIIIGQKRNTTDERMHAEFSEKMVCMLTFEFGGNVVVQLQYSYDRVYVCLEIKLMQEESLSDYSRYFLLLTKLAACIYLKFQIP